LDLINVAGNIYETFNNSHTVVGIYLDLQKAFDTVNRDILLYKLSVYGIQTSSIQRREQKWDVLSDYTRHTNHI